VSPVIPSDVHQEFDLAHVFAGARVVFTSDQHFGVGSNLILPGRGTAFTAPRISFWALPLIPSLKHAGKDMGDGWETKRSRQPGHKDWVIIKL
jgi:allantoicase